MYIIKNALKSISRSKGRSLLIAIIVLVISTSTCIGLSIRNAAENARETALEGLTITAQISVDRSAMMEGIKTNMSTSEDSEQSGKPSFDKDSFMTSMKGMESLTVEEMKTYAELDSVKSFYYTTSVSMNGSEVQYEDGSEMQSSNQFQQMEAVQRMVMNQKTVANQKTVTKQWTAVNQGMEKIHR